MVSRGLHVLLALVISPPLAACVLQQSLADRLREDQVPRDALVALSEDRAVAAAITGTQVRVFHFWNQAEGWQAQQIASSNFDSGGTVQLLSLAGETGDNWNTFVFGTAPAKVSKVVLAGFTGEGGRSLGALGHRSSRAGRNPRRSPIGVP